MGYIDRLINAIEEREKENPSYGFMAIVSRKYLAQMYLESPDSIAFTPQGSTDNAEIIIFHRREVIVDDRLMEGFSIENWELA